VTPQGNKRRRPAIPGISVYPRGKTFAYNVELPADSVTGERRREYAGGFATEEEAWSEAVKVKNSQEEGRLARSSRRTVAQFLTEWLETVQQELKGTTYTNYRDYSTAYVIPLMGRRRLQEVDVPTLNAFYRRLLDSGRLKPDNNSVMYAFWQEQKAKGQEPTPAQISRTCKTSIHAARAAVLRYRRGRIPVRKPAGLAPKTVKNVHRMLHRALSDAVAWRYTAYNPAVHASLPRTGRGKKNRPEPWTVPQLIAWLEVARNDRDAGMWMLAATTGMRRSELAGTRRDLLDLDAGTLVIEPTRVVVAGRAEESDGKTDSSQRTISLDVFTVAALRRQLAMLDEEAAAFGQAPAAQGHLFCHPDGRPLHPDTITRRFNRLVDQVGVPRIRLHDVRHTYATACLDAGINPKLISDRIGHSSTAFTLTTYTHRSTGQDRAVAEDFARLLFADATPAPGSQPSPDPGSDEPREGTAPQP